MKEIAKRIVKDLKHYKWAILLFLIYYFAMKHFFGAYCPLVLATGFPCPACGMTRAVFFFLTGQFVRAFYMQPTIFLWATFGVYIFFFRYVKGTKPKGARAIAIALLIILILVYLYRMLTVFPGYPPVSYTRGNWLAENSTFYQYVLRKTFGIW